MAADELAGMVRAAARDVLPDFPVSSPTSTARAPVRAAARTATWMCLAGSAPLSPARQAADPGKSTLPPTGATCSAYVTRAIRFGCGPRTPDSDDRCQPARPGHDRPRPQIG